MLVRLGGLPDVFMEVPPGRFKHRYGDRRWHPGHGHHPKLDTWNGRSSGRRVSRGESAGSGDRPAERSRVSDGRDDREQPRSRDKDKDREKKGKKNRDKGSKGGHGNR